MNILYTIPNDISVDNIDDYLGRSDVQYVDLRNFDDKMAEGYVRGFEFIPLVDYIEYTNILTRDGDWVFESASLINQAALESLFDSTKTIILMDDNGFMADYVKDALESIGYKDVFSIGGYPNYQGSNNVSGDGNYRVDVSTPFPTDITMENLDSYLGLSNVLYIDLRDFDEKIDDGYIDGFTFLPFYDYLEVQNILKRTDNTWDFTPSVINNFFAINALFDQDKIIFLVDSNGERSGFVKEALEFLGYDDVYNIGAVSDYTGDYFIPAENDMIRLGLIGPLTGDYGLYGLSVYQGALLAANEINAAGGVLGKDLEIIAEDSKGDPVLGVQAYNKFINEDHIHALIGGTFSGVTLALKSLAIEDNLPVLSPTATNPDVTLDADNVFRICYTDSYQGKVAAVFAATHLNATNAAVIYNRDDAYSEGLASAFMAEFNLRGLDYDVYQFGGNDDDFSSILISIKNGDYDTVFLPTYIYEASQFLTQADALGIEIPFIGGDGWSGIEENFASVAEGHYFGSHFSLNDETTLVQDFVTNYTDTYSETPNALSALAYDAVYAMVAAMTNAGSLESSDIIAALADLELSTGVTGSLQFDENGDPSKGITYIQIVNGEQVVIEKVSAD